MNYLVDSNIFLEILLDQDKSAEAQQALSTVDVNDFYVTNFALHSIGVKVFSERLFDTFRQMMTEVIDQAGVVIASLSHEDTENIISAGQRFTLDFDDAYQYTASEKYNLQIISFNSDFDKTTLERKTPLDIK